MSGKPYTDEFKIEAVRQVSDRGYLVTEVPADCGSRHTVSMPG